MCKSWYRQSLICLSLGRLPCRSNTANQDLSYTTSSKTARPPSDGGWGLVSPTVKSSPHSHCGCRANLCGSGCRIIQGGEVSTKLLFGSLGIYLLDTFCNFLCLLWELDFLLPASCSLIFLWLLSIFKFSLHIQTHRGTTRILKIVSPFASWATRTTGKKKGEKW